MIHHRSAEGNWAWSQGYISGKFFPREQLDQEMKAAGFKVQASHEFRSKQFFVIYVPE
jgi:hypothetical protein